MDKEKVVDVASKIAGGVIMLYGIFLVGDNLGKINSLITPDDLKALHDQTDPSVFSDIAAAKSLRGGLGEKDPCTSPIRKSIDQAAEDCGLSDRLSQERQVYGKYLDEKGIKAKLNEFQSRGLQGADAIVIGGAVVLIPYFKSRING